MASLIKIHLSTSAEIKIVFSRDVSPLIIFIDVFGTLKRFDKNSITNLFALLSTGGAVIFNRNPVSVFINSFFEEFGITFTTKIIPSALTVTLSIYTVLNIPTTIPIMFSSPKPLLDIIRELYTGLSDLTITSSTFLDKRFTKNSSL